MQSVLNAFHTDKEIVSCARYGHGHINETYLLVSASGRRYILQKINRHIFADVPGLMENIARVTDFLCAADDDPRHVLHLVQTVAGESYYHSDEGEYYRVYDFIENSVCLDRAETPEQFYGSAVAFGSFQSSLSEFPAETLHETIPRFHDTSSRVEAFLDAVKQDACARADGARTEIDFVLKRLHEAARMTDMLKKGELPLRVTHNDTKLNNVMLDKDTFLPLCVIDLDTIMPGLAGNDFGDSIRFGASTAAEDERDLSKVSMSLTLFDVYARGFLESCGARLTDTEIQTLPMAAKLMTFECGVRFLADHLSGDTYFRIHRPGHNLDRCRTQFRLVTDMEDKWREMETIIADRANSVRFG